MYPDKWVKLLQLNLEYFKIATNNIKKKNKKIQKSNKKNVNESVIWEGFRNI